MTKSKKENAMSAAQVKEAEVALSLEVWKAFEKVTSAERAWRAMMDQMKDHPGFPGSALLLAHKTLLLAISDARAAWGETVRDRPEVTMAMTRRLDAEARGETR